MPNDGWEYVKRKNVKNKKNVKNVKSQSDQLKYNEGIPSDETAFSGLMDLEKRKEEKRFDKNNKNDKIKNDQQLNNQQKISADTSKKKKNVQNAQNAQTMGSPKAKPKPPATFEECVKQLSVKEFTEMMEETKARFPDSPLIWLKDIAYYLNDKIPFEGDDPLFTNKPFDYPFATLPNAIRELMIKNIRQCPEPVLNLFQEQTLVSIITNMVKLNIPTMGFRMTLQCLAFQYPNMTLKNIQKFILHRDSYQNRQTICLPLLWIAAQSGVKDLGYGIKIWLQLMFPIIGLRAYTKFVIDTLDNLLKIHTDVASNSNAIDIPHYFKIFDFIFAQNNLQQNFQKQLLQLYPKLRRISIESNPTKTSPLYFPFYLERLNKSNSPELQKEILSQLVYCLSINQCFSVWRTLYSQYLIPSSILLRHLSVSCNKLPSVIPKKLLRETLNNFKVTNDDVRVHSKSLPEGHVQCEQHIEELITKMSHLKMPLKPFILLLSVSLVLFLAYDTRAHGSFQKSITGKMLRDSGLMTVAEHAWDKIGFYSGKGYGWMSDNLPIYWAAVSSVFGPYVTLFWQKFSQVSVYIWDSTEFIRIWINKTVPPLLEKITEHYVPKLQSILWQGIVNLQSYFSVVSAFIVTHMISIGNWLQTHVFVGSLAPENIMKIAVQTVETLQNYAGDAYHWISNQYMGLVN